MSESPRSIPPARLLWMIAGISFFVAGVVFTFVTPDNIALGISFLGLGVVFFSLSSTLGGQGGQGGQGEQGEQSEQGEQGDQPSDKPHD